MADFPDFPSVPVDLAPAALVRRRGEQRRARARAAVGAAMAMVVVAVGGTAVALTDGAGKPDSLVPATASPNASPTPEATPEVPVTDDGIVSPAALLQPSDASRAIGGTWTRGRYGYGSDGGAVLMVCDLVELDPVAGFGGQLQRGPEHVIQHVLRFDSAARAAAVRDRVRSEAQRCPRRAADSESGTGYAENRLVPLRGGAVGLEQKSADCTDCASGIRYWAVVAEGPYVGYLSAGAQEDLQTWSDAMTARLAACATESCPSLELPAGTDLPTQVVLHEGDRLWTVTIGAEPEDAPSRDTSNEQARYNAHLLGYVTRVLPASCLKGSIDPGATMPETARLVTVSFASQEAAAAFRESFRLVGGPASEPRLVTAVCPVG